VTRRQARRATRGRALRLTVLVTAGLLVGACTTGGEPPAESAPTSSAGAAEPTAPATSPSAAPEPPPAADTCRSLSPGDLRSIVDESPTVSCRRPHTVRTFHVGEIPASAARDALSSADAEVETAADRQCRRRFRSYVGGDGSDRRLTMLTPTYFLPPTDQFSLGARWVRCDVYAYATPTQLLELPPRLEGALDRRRTAAALARCSPVSPSAPRFRHVVCSRPHRWRAVATQELGRPNERYPGGGAIQRRARSRCEAPVRDYLTTDAAFSYGFEVPRRDAWAEGDRLGLCWARTAQ
jgi:hypothetical protein